MRRAARTDTNQSDIVAALKAIGAEVTSLAGVGSGVPDLLVSFRGQWHLMEVKDGSRPPSQRALKWTQQRWRERQQAPVHVVHGPAEAVEVLNG